MTIRKSSHNHSPAYINSFEIDPIMLKRAKRILGFDSDTQTVNLALSMVIVNHEMETAIENAFGSEPLFKTP